MAYKINDECMACGLCERTSPNGAISEGDVISVIDANRCTECVGANPAPLCMPECPSDAIELDASRAETQDELLAKWRLHTGRDTQAVFGNVTD